ncbi:MAG: LysM peptidoglycan-binding domain-containing protein [Salibacteraceae bacterium]
MKAIFSSLFLIVSVLFVSATELENIKKDTTKPEPLILRADLDFTSHIDEMDSQLWKEWSVGYKDSTELNTYNYPEDSIPLLTDSLLKARLTELNELTPFDLGYNQRVHAFINLYAVKRRTLSSKTMGLSQLYFPLMEEILDKYDMPYEIKYLAVVESALNPTARSRAGAKGLWQFMYSTGKMYGLTVNSYIDERNDPYKATEAACGYLSYLYKYFDDWNLALAAYNCGPGNVNKAIRRSGGKRDYWEIYPYLPRETRGYVPAFIAVNYVFNYASEHNLYPQSPVITNYETDTIIINDRVSFDYLSSVLDITAEEIQYLNPEYKRGVIPADGRLHVLKLPKEQLALYLVNEKAIKEHYVAPIDQSDEILAQQERIEIYRVRNGDYLGKIASRHGVSVRQIRDWNGLRSDNLKIGQRLTIYSNAAPAPKKKSSVNLAKNSTQGSGYTYYQIQKGDTLWDIAKAKGISTNELKSLNKNLNERNLKPGDKIIIGKKA